MDNAGVYKLSADLAIVQTIDFFTPIVDDPFMFGQIAVANSLSDIYTMGGKPITALNIVCFPTKTMEMSILKEVLRGGAEKLREAGVVLIGGHSIDDIELKYGVSVTGTVHPKLMITNGGALPGDRLILTKPLGTGIISTAIKAGIAGKQLIDEVSQSMAALNKPAAEVMLADGVRACTDITGFGFLGHAAGMAKNSSVSFEIEAAAIPVFAEAHEYAEMGLRPGGLFRNRDFYSGSVTFAAGVPEYLHDILFDPQTSGGLLITVNGEKAKTLLQNLHRAGVSQSHIIGKVTSGNPGHISVL
jgi:selenide,water dikinase